MDSVAYIAAHDAVYVLATYDYSNPAKLRAVSNDGKALRPPMACVLSADTADAKIAADSNCLCSNARNISIGCTDSSCGACTLRIDAASFDEECTVETTLHQSYLLHDLGGMDDADTRSTAIQKYCHWPHVTPAITHLGHE